LRRPWFQVLLSEELSTPLIRGEVLSLSTSKLVDLPLTKAESWWENLARRRKVWIIWWVAIVAIVAMMA
jgi:hypothetical protein